LEERSWLLLQMRDADRANTNGVHDTPIEGVGDAVVLVLALLVDLRRRWLKSLPKPKQLSCQQ
jgi:hypothetical protein